MTLAEMSAYERRRWDDLNAHWEKRANRRGLPNWVQSTGSAVGRTAKGAVAQVRRVTPDWLDNAAAELGGAALDKALRPTVRALTHTLELLDDWVLELTDPEKVVAIARRHGLQINHFSELKHVDVRDCDRLLSRHTLKWRTVGALEGAGLGLVALIPYAGIPTSILVDVAIIQGLSVAIASRVAYSYGFDAKDPAEQEFIARLVRRALVTQAGKTKPLNDAAQAAHAAADRVRWSKKLREDHQLIAALEKLMSRWYPNAKVPVQHVAKAVPVVNVVVGAGSNSWLLGAVAEDARRFCATRFLCEKYGLPLPPALLRYGDDDEGAETEKS